MTLPLPPQDGPRSTHECILRCTIPGEPVAKQRPRAGRGGHFYTPAKTREAEAAIGWIVAAKRRAPLEEGPLCLQARFYCRRAKDTDNMLKLLSDSLNGIVWKDDRQVVQVHACRYDKAARPRTEIAVFRIIELDAADRARKSGGI